MRPILKERQPGQRSILVPAPAAVSAPALAQAPVAAPAPAHASVRFRRCPPPPAGIGESNGHSDFCDRPQDANSLLLTEPQMSTHSRDRPQGVGALPVSGETQQRERTREQGSVGEAQPVDGRQGAAVAGREQGGRVSETLGGLEYGLMAALALVTGCLPLLTRKCVG